MKTDPTPRGCETCRAQHLGHLRNGVLFRDSDDGLQIVAEGAGGASADALYECPGCGSYRRGGGGADFQSVWLPIKSAADLAAFRSYIVRKARDLTITEDELTAHIVGHSVWSVRARPPRG